MRLLLEYAQLLRQKSFLRIIICSSLVSFRNLRYVLLNCLTNLLVRIKDTDFCWNLKFSSACTSGCLNGKLVFINAKFDHKGCVAVI